MNTIPDQNIPASKCFQITKKDGAYWAAATGEAPFYLGKDLRYGTRRGLGMPVSTYYGPRFCAQNYTGRIGHWAILLELMAANESKGYFNVINAYDRAAFTFGCFQLAAHTPGDNLVLLFRRLLQLPDAADYFPELSLRNGRIHRIGEQGGYTDLEASAERFMAYLNPDGKRVDDQELLQAARLIHWSNTHAAMRDAQVEIAAEITARKVDAVYDRRYALDGKSDTLVALVCDIHHQGRAKVPVVRAALAQAQPEEALLKIGQEKYPERIANLRRNIEAMKQDGQLGRKRYQSATNSFVEG
jgi:hypothetical protein